MSGRSKFLWDLCYHGARAEDRLRLLFDRTALDLEVVTEEPPIERQQSIFGLRVYTDQEVRSEVLARRNRRLACGAVENGLGPTLAALESVTSALEVVSKRLPGNELRFPGNGREFDAGIARKESSSSGEPK